MKIIDDLVQKRSRSNEFLFTDEEMEKIHESFQDHCSVLNRKTQAFMEFLYWQMGPMLDDEMLSEELTGNENNRIDV